jgi:hypothetical protein
MPSWARILLVVLTTGVVVSVLLAPLIGEPTDIQCVDVEASLCDQIWRQEAAYHVGLLALLPITAVKVEALPFQSPTYCYGIEIRRLIVTVSTRRIC